MNYLYLEDYVVGKYDINLEIENNKLYLVFCKNKEYVNRFIISLSGINKHQGICNYKNNPIFDNPDYFKNRLLINFNTMYIRTLNSKIIEEAIKSFPHIKFNPEEFKKVVNETDIRREILIKDEYTFTNKGISLTNYALIKSMDFKNLLVLNPYTRNDSVIKEKVILELQNRNKYNTVIIANNNLEFLSKYVDKIIVLTDYTYVDVIDKEDTFLVCDDNIYLHNRLFKNDNIIISKNNYSKDELKTFSKNNLKYKIIKFKELISMIGNKYD